MFVSYKSHSVTAMAQAQAQTEDQTPTRGVDSKTTETPKIKEEEEVPKAKEEEDDATSKSGDDSESHEGDGDDSPVESKSPSKSKKRTEKSKKTEEKNALMAEVIALSDEEVVQRIFNESPDIFIAIKDVNKGHASSFAKVSRFFAPGKFEETVLENDDLKEMLENVFLKHATPKDLKAWSGLGLGYSQERVETIRRLAASSKKATGGRKSAVGGKKAKESKSPKSRKPRDETKAGLRSLLVDYLKSQHREYWPIRVPKPVDTYSDVPKETQDAIKRLLDEARAKMKGATATAATT